MFASANGFVNPQLLIQLAVYKIKEPLTAVLCTPEGYLKSDEEGTSPLTAPYGEKEKGVVPLEATEKGLQFHGLKKKPDF